MLARAMLACSVVWDRDPYDVTENLGSLSLAGGWMLRLGHEAMTVVIGGVTWEVTGWDMVLGEGVEVGGVWVLDVFIFMSLSSIKICLKCGVVSVATTQLTASRLTLVATFFQLQLR